MFRWKVKPLTISIHISLHPDVSQKTNELCVVISTVDVGPQESDEDSLSATNPEQALSLKCDEWVLYAIVCVAQTQVCILTAYSRTHPTHFLLGAGNSLNRKQTHKYMRGLLVAVCGRPKWSSSFCRSMQQGLGTRSSQSRQRQSNL